MLQLDGWCQIRWDATTICHRKQSCLHENDQQQTWEEECSHIHGRLAKVLYKVIATVDGCQLRKPDVAGYVLHSAWTRAAKRDEAQRERQIDGR